MNRYTIGLATTLHDPAIAILNPAGEVVFAEATERYLQYKRAFNCEPDPLFRIAELIEELHPKATSPTAQNPKRHSGPLPVRATLITL